MINKASNLSVSSPIAANIFIGSSQNFHQEFDDKLFHIVCIYGRAVQDSCFANSVLSSGTMGGLSTEAEMFACTHIF